MTIGEATEVQKLITAVMYTRDNAPVGAGELNTDRICEALIVIADRSHKAMRDCPTAALAVWTGDKIRRACPKPPDWRMP